MLDKTTVLVAGRSADGLDAIVNSLRGVPGIKLDSFLMTNGTSDPVTGLDQMPDVLILHSDPAALKSLAERPVEIRPTLLIIGTVPPEAMRLTVRAGAKDLIDEGDTATLVRSLQEVVEELSADSAADHGRITAVINAKGGSGATFIATSLAHLAAINAQGDTVVVDLDCQFGSLPDYFDMRPKRSLLEALAYASELDRVAVTAFSSEHSSGLRIMAPLPDVAINVDFDIQLRMRQLLDILKNRYGQVIVDVPRHVDDFSAPVLNGADQILMIVQQSLPSVRDAVRLKTTLVREMGIDASRLHAVVNRHAKAASVELQDIKEALGESELLLVPNHYRAVGQAIDIGVPIAEASPGSPVAKALFRMQEKMFVQHGSMHNGNVASGGSPIERLKKWSPF